MFWSILIFLLCSYFLFSFLILHYPIEFHIWKTYLDVIYLFQAQKWLML